MSILYNFTYYIYRNFVDILRRGVTFTPLCVQVHTERKQKKIYIKKNENIDINAKVTRNNDLYINQISLQNIYQTSLKILYNKYYREEGGYLFYTFHIYYTVQKKSEPNIKKTEGWGCHFHSETHIHNWFFLFFTQPLVQTEFIFRRIFCIYYDLYLQQIYSGN